MKNLILKVCLLFTSLLSTPAFSGIGDVYYCVTDMFVIYDEEKNSIKYDTKGYKFKFKWEETKIEFSGDFIYSGPLYLIKTMIYHLWTAVFRQVGVEILHFLKNRN